MPARKETLMSTVTLEKEVPPGFYYHHEHNSSGEIANRAYEVIGLGFHTNPGDGWPGDDCFVIYRPLYSSTRLSMASEKSGTPHFHAEPLADWKDVVPKDGGYVPKFRKITDPLLIEILTGIRDKMYGSKQAHATQSPAT